MHLRTCVKGTHRPASRTQTRMARRRANQYRVIPGVHPHRLDRQSASTPSATNHTFSGLSRRRQFHPFDREIDVWTIASQVSQVSLLSFSASLYPAFAKRQHEKLKRYKKRIKT